MDAPLCHQPDSVDTVQLFEYTRDSSITNYKPLEVWTLTELAKQKADLLPPVGSSKTKNLAL